MHSRNVRVCKSRRKPVASCRCGPLAENTRGKKKEKKKDLGEFASRRDPFLFFSAIGRFPTLLPCDSVRTCARGKKSSLSAIHAMQENTHSVTMSKPDSPIRKAIHRSPSVTMRRLPPEVACLVLDRLDGADLSSCLDLAVFVNVDADKERRRRAERRSRGVKKRDLVRRGDVGALQYIHETRGARFFLQDVALAAAGGHLDAMAWLYKHAQGGHPYGAIEAAAAGGHLAAVTWLVEQDNPIDATSLTRGVIIKAAKGGHLAVIEYACEGRVVEHHAAWVALMKAARHDHIDVVQPLCRPGRFAYTDNEVDRIVDMAAERGHADIVGFLYARFGRSGTVHGLFGAVGNAHVATAVRLCEADPQRTLLLSERPCVIGPDAPSAALWRLYETRTSDGMPLFHGPRSYQNHRMTARTMGLVDVACATGSVDMVTALWERQAGAWTHSLLCCAVMGGNADILRHLIAHHEIVRDRAPHCWSWRDLADAVGDAFVLARPDLAILAERLYRLLADDPEHPVVCEAPLAPVDDAALADFYARALTNDLHQRGCIIDNAVVSGNADLVADLQTRGFSIASVWTAKLVNYGNVDLLRSLTDEDLREFDGFVATHSLFCGRQTDMVRYIYVERGIPVPDVLAADDDGDGTDEPFEEYDSLVAGLVSDPHADADLVAGILARYEAQGDARIAFRINRVLLAAIEHGRGDIVDAVAAHFPRAGDTDLTIDEEFGRQGCDAALLARVCGMFEYVAWHRPRLYVYAARRNDRATTEWLCDHGRLSDDERTEAIDVAAGAGHRRLVEWMWERGFRPSSRYTRAPLCTRKRDYDCAGHHAAECFLFGRTG